MIRESLHVYGNEVIRHFIISNYSENVQQFEGKMTSGRINVTTYDIVLNSGFRISLTRYMINIIKPTIFPL